MAAYNFEIVMAWRIRMAARTGLDSLDHLFLHHLHFCAGGSVGLAVWRSIIGIGIDYRSISHDVKQRKNDGVAINIFQGGKLCA